jgi:hypothetical protein
MLIAFFFFVETDYFFYILRSNQLCTYSFRSFYLSWKKSYDDESQLKILEPFIWKIMAWSDGKG